MRGKVFRTSCLRAEKRTVFFPCCIFRESEKSTSDLISILSCFFIIFEKF